MNLTAILILGACLQVAAKTEGQTITFSGKNVPLEQTFSVIEKQTGYVVFCNYDLLKNTKKVSMNANNMPLDEFLEAVLDDQGLTFSKEDKTIVISKKSLTENLSQRILKIVSNPVTGVVRGSDGQPIAGANVQIKGTNKGTVTDANGKFSIEVENGKTLVISFVGYSSREIKVNGEKNLIVDVEISSTNLDEVQYIAYGQTSRRLSTSNIGSVKSKDIERQPVNNPLLALAGRVPGLQITQATGMPGSAVTVRIQGQNSISNGNDPLYVIDGVPYFSRNLNTFQGGGTFGTSIGRQGSVGSPLSYINSTDIESIDILKDADATAIYGSRAANGAILITTKKGKAGNTRIDVNLQQGWGKVGHFMHLMNSQEYLEMRNEALKNDNSTVAETDYDLNGLWDTSRYTNWQKTLIGGTAHYSQFSASASGGTNNTQYLIGATYHRETTVFPGSFASTSGAVHFNINSASANQKFHLQLSGNYLVNNSNLSGVDLTPYVFFAPVAPKLYNADGTLNWMPDINGVSSWANPLANLYNPFSTKASSLVSNAVLSYKILPGLELKSSFGYTTLISNQFSAQLIDAAKPEERPYFFRYASFSFNTAKSWIIEPQLIYTKSFGNSKLELLLGGTVQQQNNSGNALTATDQANDQLLGSIDAATSLYPAGTDISTYKYNAGFGRLNYNWKDKYILNVAARRDGSSRFGDKDKFHDFYSVAGAWIFTQQQFIKRSLPFLSFGKLRGSYGTTGSDQIANYQYLNLYIPISVQIPYGGAPSLTSSGLPNPYLQWEETRKLQMGIDLGVLDDKILLSATYIRNRSSNQLLPYSLPIITGFTGISSNFPALVQNTAWEFTANTENVHTNRFKWTSSFNFTHPNNKLIAFPDLASSAYKNLAAIGQSLEESGYFRFFRFYGVDPAIGIYQVYDQQGNPTTTPTYPADANVYFNSKPRWYGGFQNTLQLGAFELDFLLQYTKQKNFNFIGQGVAGFFKSGMGNQPVTQLGRWQKPGDVANIQRFSADNSLGAYSSGDQAIQDVSFLRLKNVSFSYSITPKVVSKARLRYLRVFVNAQNAYTITKYKGLDPENLTFSTLPPLRIITAGISVGL